MPEVFRRDGLRYFFYSNEGSPREPVHVHVGRGGAEAKFWLRPLVSLGYNEGLTQRELREAGRTIAEEREQIERAGMRFSPERVRFDDDAMWVDISDGRTIGVPLMWFPRLLDATPAQREAFELSRRGIHWEALDEDISVDALLRGLGDQTRRRTVAA